MNNGLIVFELKGIKYYLDRNNIRQSGRNIILYIDERHHVKDPMMIGEFLMRLYKMKPTLNISVDSLSRVGEFSMVSLDEFKIYPSQC